MVFFTIKIFMMTRKHCCVFVFTSFLALLFEAGAMQECTGHFCRQGTRGGSSHVLCGRELPLYRSLLQQLQQPHWVLISQWEQPALGISPGSAGFPGVGQEDWSDWVWGHLVWNVLLPKAGAGDPWGPFQPHILWIHEVSDWRQVLNSGNGLKWTLLTNTFKY